MTGIKKVVLKNIRSHLDTVVEFDPHFNVVAGESDRGKSTVFWAIRAVMENPRGWNPRPWKRLKPKGESRIELHFFDKTVVARVWDKGKNTYELNGEVLSGLHNRVPDRVQEALNMNDANIQAQKDMFFLLNETSGKVAREINRVTNLEVMDKAITLANTRVKKTRKTISGLETLLKDWTKEIKEKQPVLEVAAALEVLETKEQTLWDQKTKLFNIEDTISSYEQLQAELDSLPSDDCVEDLEQLQKDRENLQQRDDNLKTISRSIDRIQELQRQLEGSELLDDIAEKLESFTIKNQEIESKGNTLTTTQNLCTQYDKAEHIVELAITDECVDDLDELVLTAGLMKEVEDRLIAISTILEDIDDAESDIVNLDDGIAIDQEELDELRGGMTVCPTCLTHLNA